MLIPKVGPLRVLSLQTPTPETEQLFEASFNTALQNYQHLLQNLRKGQLNLPNRNLDTGGVAAPGVYFMMDGAYARLLDRLASKKFDRISPALRADILAYFMNFSLRAPIRFDKLDKSKVHWSRVPQQLQALTDSAPQMISTSAPTASKSNF